MNLSDYLSEAGLKPAEFADKLGVPPSTIGRLLNGERSPRLETIAKIEAATGGRVTVQDFYEQHRPTQSESPEPVQPEPEPEPAL